MDLAYNPGELDFKNDKEIKHDLEHKNDRELKESGSGLKRDHDSVDDFEHLDPDSSPVDIPFDSKSLTTTTKSLKSDLDKNDEVPKSDEFSFGNGFSNGKDLLSDFKLDSHQPKKDSVEINFKNNQMDFEISSDNHPITVNTEQDNGLNLNFISAEKAVNSKKTDSESDLIGLETSDKETGKIVEVVHDDVPTLPKEADDVSGLESKSMKEADAMSHYDLKLDKKDDQIDQDMKNAPELNKSHKDSEVISPSSHDSESHAVADKEISNSKDLETKEDLSSSHPKPEPLEPKSYINKPPSAKDPVKEKPKVHEESKDFSPADDTFQHRVCISPSKPESSVPAADLGLDDIIGPEDVFKRFGLVEALVYWRDPKKSGAVFGVVMAILVSLCFFSLISVLAYTSLFALVGAINFRIYKNILQAVQKTSEGHPFKEYLDMELSLPQDKVREMTDTAVVHINAAIVELRRLFLVEDLIDSMKFAVCLWCFTYVGAIFNGMTLVILAFVALFTVPKIYENNKASIDTYIDMGRSKVAEITSKVKAAVPIGKKEPEKDKEQ